MQEAKKKRKIGIMGGTFNPIHNGHLQLAEHAYRDYVLDEVIFMPSHRPVYKQGIYIVDDGIRVEMIKRAISGRPYFSISTMELDRGGNTYTIDTMKALREQMPDCELYFLIGADSLLQLETWYKAEELLKITNFLVAIRSGSTLPQMKAIAQKLYEKYGTQIGFLSMQNIDISSSEIRNRIYNSLDVSGMLPASVLDYMEEKRVYMNKLSEIEQKLKSVLKEKRFTHTTGVRYTAASLAMCHGCDIKKAQLAGLLHDCAKGYSEEELLLHAKEYGLDISKWEKRAPHLLHAKVGAYLAEHEYHIEDAEVLDAIRYHTTGRPNMSELEKIIFIADYIEPNRKMLEGLPECRKLAFEDLDEAMYQILHNTLQYLRSKNDDTMIDQMTAEAYDYYKKLIR